MAERIAAGTYGVAWAACYASHDQAELRRLLRRARKVVRGRRRGLGYVPSWHYGLWSVNDLKSIKPRLRKAIKARWTIVTWRQADRGHEVWLCRACGFWLHSVGWGIVPLDDARMAHDNECGRLPLTTNEGSQ